MPAFSRVLIFMGLEKATVEMTGGGIRDVIATWIIGKMGLTSSQLVDINREMSTISKLKVAETVAKAQLRKSSILTFIKRDYSPYIVLLTIFILIGLLISGSMNLKPRRKAKRSSKFMPSFNPLGYRSRLLMRMITPFSGKQPSVPRQRIMSGRCDNNLWLQVDESDNPQLNVDGKRGYCMSAVRPKDIEWKMDASQMPELTELPAEVKKSANAKMTVVIPYDKDDTVKNGNTFFVPRCDKAYYKDAKDANGKPLAAPILEEMGTTCKRVSYPFAKGSYGVDGATKAALLQTKQWQ